jgi:hypothetical protein
LQRGGHGGAEQVCSIGALVVITLSRRSLVWAVLLIIIVMGIVLFSISSRSPYIPKGFKPIPILSAQDGISTAELVAHEWDKSSFLVKINSEYGIDHSEAHLRTADYEFVSGDRRSYLKIEINGSGGIQADQPIVIANIGVWKNDGFPRSPLDKRRGITFGNLKVSEAESLIVAWNSFGKIIDNYCGPLNKVTVEYLNYLSINLPQSGPYWLIGYYSGLSEEDRGGFSVDAVTAEPNQFDIPGNCLNFQDPVDLIQH